MIFHGPHAYISPANYEIRENVPTWNYGAVHAYGEARTFSEIPSCSTMLDDLNPDLRSRVREQWATLNGAVPQRMFGHIVGFEISLAVWNRNSNSAKTARNRSSKT